eukprot:scaffold2908_cov257-Pinguiococcus_pyrenoidosus.AAC.2
MEVVLQRRSREQQAMLGLHFADGHAELTGLVLQPMRLVDDHVAPGELGEGSPLPIGDLVGRDHDIPLSIVAVVGLQNILDEVLALFSGAVEADHAKRRTPPRELVHPVAEGGLGDQDDVRASDVLVLHHVAQDADRLQRLAESHLVRQDAVDAVLVQANHPVQALKLVWPQLSRHTLWLRQQEVVVVFLALFGLFEHPRVLLFFAHAALHRRFLRLLFLLRLLPLLLQLLTSGRT